MVRAPFSAWHNLCSCPSSAFHRGNASFSFCATGVDMRRTRKEGPKLSFGHKVTRLGHRLRDREWRKYGLTLIAGKFLGLLVLLAVIWAVKQYATYGTVFADEPAT